LSINLGDFVPGFIDDYVASLMAAQLDPSTFGGTAVGPQQFELDTNPPFMAFGALPCRSPAAAIKPIEVLFEFLVNERAIRDTV
jgi:hypothetical protein